MQHRANRINQIQIAIKFLVANQDFIFIFKLGLILAWFKIVCVMLKYCLQLSHWWIKGETSLSMLWSSRFVRCWAVYWYEILGNGAISQYGPMSVLNRNVTQCLYTEVLFFLLGRNCLTFGVIALTYLTWYNLGTVSEMQCCLKLGTAHPAFHGSMLLPI